MEGCRKYNRWEYKVNGERGREGKRKWEKRREGTKREEKSTHRKEKKSENEEERYEFWEGNKLKRIDKEMRAEQRIGEREGQRGDGTKWTEFLSKRSEGKRREKREVERRKTLFVH